MSRRWLRFLLTFLVLAAAALLLDAFWLEPSSIRVARYDVPVPQRLKGLRLAVISDLHAGAPYIDTAKIDRIVAMTNAAAPDLIVLTGDYVVGRKMLGSRAMAIETIAAHLKPLKARLGAYAVLGNHDASQADRISAAFNRIGIPMLRNQHVVLGDGRFALAGMQEYYIMGAEPKQALGDVTDDAICIMHAPDPFPALPRACVLTIAGHTHGGQVWLPFLGRPAVGWIASRYGQRYALGVIREQGRTLFVSSGIGTSGLPVRFGVPPEISLLTLR